LQKAIESLAGAESEYAQARFNNSANRAYYAAFQAAVAALLQHGIHASGSRWPHQFVHAEFADKLVNRRHLYPARLRKTLEELQRIRHQADYRGSTITEARARRSMRLSREFVRAVSAPGDNNS
jgi:uncharacterized protein (UPF0332 family)